jgi:hypothetical protein
VRNAGQGSSAIGANFDSFFPEGNFFIFGGRVTFYAVMSETWHNAHETSPIWAGLTLISRVGL